MLIFFAVDTLRIDPATFVAILVIALLAVVFDFLWKRRGAPPDAAPPEPAREIAA